MKVMLPIISLPGSTWRWSIALTGVLALNYHVCPGARSDTTANVLPTRSPELSNRLNRRKAVAIS
jgi:hypothetical protein